VGGAVLVTGDAGGEDNQPVLELRVDVDARDCIKHEDDGADHDGHRERGDQCRVPDDA
jgi:hypothetical protein